MASQKQIYLFQNSIQIQDDRYARDIFRLHLADKRRSIKNLPFPW